MPLDHERLDVYHVALEFLALATTTIDAMPRGRSHLADQLSRSSTSIVLNIAEGVGKFSRPDKRRFYMIARGSAMESAALLDVYLRLKVIDDEMYRSGKALLERIVSMLVKLVRNCE